MESESSKDTQSGAEANRNFVRINSILNRKDNQLPFAYYSPETEGKVTWNCGYDQNDKICAVFAYKNGNEEDRRTAMLPTLQDAIMYRDGLIKAGWLPLDPPKITVKYDDGSEGNLNRKQKRGLTKKLEKMSKNLPTEEEKKPV